jgi:hypothetical protein
VNGYDLRWRFRSRALRSCVLVLRPVFRHFAVGDRRGGGAHCVAETIVGFRVWRCRMWPTTLRARALSGAPPRCLCVVLEHWLVNVQADGPVSSASRSSRCGGRTVPRCVIYCAPSCVGVAATLRRADVWRTLAYSLLCVRSPCV